MRGLEGTLRRMEERNGNEEKGRGKWGGKFVYWKKVFPNVLTTLLGSLCASGLTGPGRDGREERGRGEEAKRRRGGGGREIQTSKSMHRKNKDRRKKREERAKRGMMRREREERREKREKKRKTRKRREKSLNLGQQKFQARP